ncbi:MAG: class I SAM-dependent methyltransferase [Actinomycetota bacterium]|nr:class I SAM-dependent methyltransferase [Actinomycetota bacterium]
MQSKVRRRLAHSPVARGAAFPLRTMMVARYDARLIGRSVDWLVHGRETTNFTYDLDPLNRDQLAWFVAAVSGATVGHARGWMDELQRDVALHDHVTERWASNPRRGISEKEPHWARRLGWYALIRAIQPDHVVETGTALGLGSCAIAAALLRNGHGRLTTVDIDPEAGCLIGGIWESVVERRTGRSIDILAGLEAVDMFLHDSLHTYDYETMELSAVGPNLGAHAVILSDNAHQSSALGDWAQRTGRRYLFFAEQPRDHWWRGDGIGAAWTQPSPSSQVGPASS